MYSVNVIINNEFITDIQNAESLETALLLHHSRILSSRHLLSLCAIANSLYYISLFLNAFMEKQFFIEDYTRFIKSCSLVNLFKLSV